MKMKHAFIVLALLFSIPATLGSSFAATTDFFPNGDVAIYYNQFDINLGGNHAIIDFLSDGTAFAVILDPSGFYVDSFYLDQFGNLLCTNDGRNWFICG